MHHPQTRRRSAIASCEQKQPHWAITHPRCNRRTCVEMAHQSSSFYVLLQQWTQRWCRWTGLSFEIAQTASRSSHMLMPMTSLDKRGQRSLVSVLFAAPPNLHCALSCATGRQHVSGERRSRWVRLLQRIRLVHPPQTRRDVQRSFRGKRHTATLGDGPSSTLQQSQLAAPSNVSGDRPPIRRPSRWVTSDRHCHSCSITAPPLPVTHLVFPAMPSWAKRSP